MYMRIKWQPAESPEVIIGMALTTFRVSVSFQV